MLIKPIQGAQAVGPEEPGGPQWPPMCSAAAGEADVDWLLVKARAPLIGCLARLLSQSGNYKYRSV